MTFSKLFLFLAFSVTYIYIKAQNNTDQIYIDPNGIMHWTTDGSEVHGFGVNYTLPFAHEFRMAKRAGVLPEKAIQQDVYHMARLDLDLYRVHVWDTEISDTLGNLLENEHLKWFDYLIAEMKKRDMHFLITPIAYWGNGWPERDENTPGFSHKYGKGAALYNPGAIKAQANYLGQFLDHVNPYTGVAYKDEPGMIGFEVCNEPHHRGDPAKVTEFINTMVAAMRATGCTKPVFYNVSQTYTLDDAYMAADIQGITFQWYPTNLVANHGIKGNFLPQVKSYPIPFADKPKFKEMAKFVYEFDPADVDGNIMYPAMARTFRESGIQLATQFDYDAMCWAQYNTNYGTHFMNLAYAPHKAISLKIASTIFHEVPMYQTRTDDEKDLRLTISYPDDMAVWNDGEKFFYSNNTSLTPVNISKLKEIAGCGSSPVIKYSGTGAYFLDKLDKGIWRLEVMPDAYWIEDPYSPANPNKQKAAVMHAERQMTLSLSDLGEDFSVSPINDGNSMVPQVTNGQFKLKPGVYLLKRKGVKKEIAKDSKYKNIRINEYVAPSTNLTKTMVWNHTAGESVVGKPVSIKFEAASPDSIRKISVVMAINNVWKTLTAQPTENNRYQVEVPAELLVNGFLNYRIIVDDNKNTTKFPGGKIGDPWSWDNRDNDTYVLNIIPENSLLILWDAATDWDFSYKIWSRSVNLKPAADGQTTLDINIRRWSVPNPMNPNDSSYAFKFFFKDKIIGRYNELAQKKTIGIKIKNLLSEPQPVELGLIDKNGSVKTAELVVKPDDTVVYIPVASFIDGQYLVIPRPYPDFIPYRVTTNNLPFEWQSLETLQLEIKPGNEPHPELEIERIWME